MATLDDEGWHFSRWASLGAGFLLAAFAGTGYAFGIFSPSLQKALQYDQEDIDMVASAGQVGMHLALVTGLLMDYCGQRITLAVGALLIFGGFQLLYLSATLVIPSSVASISLFYFAAQLGCSALGITTISVAIKNFPFRDRGKVAGLAKAYFGISSSVFAELYYCLYEPDGIGFLRFTSVAVPLVVFLSMATFTILPPEKVPYDKEECSRSLGTSKKSADEESPSSPCFKLWYRHLGALIVFLLGVSFFSQFSPGSSTGLKAALATVLFGLLGMVHILPRYYGNLKQPKSGGRPYGEQVTPTSAAPCSNLVSESQPLLDREGRPSEKGEWLVNTAHKGVGAAAGQDLGLWKALQQPSFWMLFLAFFCGTGSGLIVINNVQQIARAVTGASPSSYFVSLIGIFNCIGRVTIGWISDVCREYVTRPQLLCLVLLCMGLVHLAFASGFQAVFYPCLVLTALCYGGQFPLTSAIVADLYGSKYMAQNYGALDTAPSFGSYIFAAGLVNFFYERDENNYYMKTFTVSSITCMSVSVLLLYVFHKKKGMHSL
uniref:Nodulin-like domain-containing protein n=1 Tax=Fibrocapsa japonica TaxID=94617 RepID=A0A7S2V0H0_9STRA